MAKQNALHDDNKWPAMIAHTGTAGTAETIRVVASSDGALRVDLVSGDTINIGTMNLGTIDLVKAGTIDMLKAGTIDKLAGGTVDMLKAGTIDKLAAGTVDMLKAGTIDKVAGGTIDMLKAGTINDGTITNIDEDYAIRIDESASGTTYYGFALPLNGGSPANAVWKILRKEYDATSSTYRFAGSAKTFSNVWDNRASLNY